RRGILAGAVAVGVAVVGGGAAWLVSSQSKTDTPATADAPSSGPGLPTAQGGAASGAGARKTAAWAFPAGSTVEASPTVAHGVARVGSKNDNVYAINVGTGKQVWKSPAGSVSAPPQVIGNVVCVCTETGTFKALKVSDGSVVWMANTQFPALWKTTWAADGGT